jgi:hypothetical protein
MLAHLKNVIEEVEKAIANDTGKLSIYFVKGYLDALIKDVQRDIDREKEELYEGH